MTAKAADPNIMEEEVEVPMDRYGKPMLSYLIGTKGKNIQWIRDESNGCEIDIPKGREQGGCGCACVCVLPPTPPPSPQS